MGSWRHLIASCLAVSPALAQSRYAANQVPLSRDSDAVAANFPDVDMELFSPAFLDPNTVPDEFTNGSMGPTSQTTLEEFLETLSARNTWLHRNTPDFTSEEGRSLPYLYLSNTEAFNGTNADDKLRIYIHGGVHGNEPAGDQAVMAFLGLLDNNATWAASILSKADFLILPRYNPDGVVYFQRYLFSGFDPNRDHVKLARQQTRHLKRLKVAFDAHISIDCHEYGVRPLEVNNNSYLPAQDGQFSAFKNPNIHPSIRDMAEGVFAPAIATAMDATSLTHGPYVVNIPQPDSPSPGSLQLNEFVTDNNGDDQVALSQGISFLSETRGIGLGAQHFARRTAAGLTVLTTIVQTAITHADVVRQAIDDAREDYAASDDEIVVTSTPQMQEMEWPFIDSASGEKVQVPVVFGNNTPPLANLTRARPEAYVFSPAWADVAERLRDVGVEVDVLSEGFEGEVEALTVTRARLAEEKFEGVVMTGAIEMEVGRREVRLPKGAFWVGARQRRAAHAFVRLEPEAESSFAAWNVLPLEVGDEYPVYRVPRRQQ